MNEMKCSYSMSSLESPPKYLRTPDGAKKPCVITPRHAASLNSKKSRRTLDKKMWRRSWGSSEDNCLDEVWREAFFQNYTQKKENKGDQVDLREFLEDYSRVSEWLNAVQVQRGQFAHADKISELRAELAEKQCWRIKINESAKSLLKNYPRLKEEFQWRVKHLNSQWDALEKILLCNKSASNFTDAITKKESEEVSGVDWLRDWLTELESKLQPLDFRAEWTSERLEEEILHHKDLQGEIEKNSSKVHEALRAAGGGRRETNKRSRLQTRWLQLRLRVLEWVQLLNGVQRRLEHSAKGTKRDNFSGSLWESDDDQRDNEPLSKYPRLASGNSSSAEETPRKQRASVLQGNALKVSSPVSSLEVSASPVSKSVPSGIKLSHSGVSALDLGSWNCGVSGLCANVVDVDVMGQSHDSESVFNQSGSPVPNSVVEFIFDESHSHSNISVSSKSSVSSASSTSSLGMKRKLSPSSPTSASQLNLHEQQLMGENPRVSTYYFKHSESETEYHRTLNQASEGLVPHNQQEKNQNGNPIICSEKNSHRHSEQLSVEKSLSSGRNNGNSRRNWQKSRVAKILDFGQKSYRGRNSLENKSGDDDEDEISLDLESEEEFSLLDKEDEVMMDLDNNINKNNSGSGISSSVRRNILDLDEIGELVQQAELLVKKSARSNNSRSVFTPLEVGPSEDEVEADDDDEQKDYNVEDKLLLGDQLNKLNSNVSCGGGSYNINKSPFLSNVKKGSLLNCNSKTSGGSSKCIKSNNHAKTNASPEGILSNNFASNTFPQRKCSGGSSSTSTLLTKCSSKSSSVWQTGATATVSMDTFTPCNNNSINNNETSTTIKGSLLGENNQNQSESVTVTSANTKTCKKSSRVRQWVRAHNNSDRLKKNTTSSCDASAESTSESECSSVDSEVPLSSDDPTTVTLTASTYLLQQTQSVLAEVGSFSRNVNRAANNPNKNLSSSCSSSNNIVDVGNSTKQCHHRSPQASVSGSGVTITSAPPVVFRTKNKRTLLGKQRPKSFTEALKSTSTHGEVATRVSSSSTCWLSSSSQNCFVSSDTALNLLGSRTNPLGLGITGESVGGGSCWSQSGSGSSAGSGSGCGNSPKKNVVRVRRRLVRPKRKSVGDVRGGESQENVSKGFVRSTSFLGETSGGLALKETEIRSGRQSTPDNKENDKGGDERQFPKPKFQISGPVSASFVQPPPTNSDNGSSMNTDTGIHEQDWDSYQEKYLSEPYSEEPYDPDGTLKLLAFGEDYGQYLERPDSESSVLSGFEPNNPRKRRPLQLSNRSEMPESDSDREELNHLLSQSAAQLKFIDTVFRKQLAASSGNNGGSPAEYAEMEATCDENIGSLKMVLSNIEERDSDLPFEVDVKSIEGVLEKWHILRERIRQAARLDQIREEMDDLKSDFSSVQSHFEDVDPFDSSDLISLQDKIGYIQEMLAELTQRKHKLQSLNEASLGTQLFLKDTNAVGIIKEQLQELYALYEENFQLGSYLLDKMRFLQDAWEKFEAEKGEFERSINAGNIKTRLRKELSSAASTDSGHGTDASHDSSISDSDMDFQERKIKLAALKKRAFEIKAFLPPGSPVMDAIEQRVFEAEKGLEDLRKSSEVEKPFDLKIIYSKKRLSPVLGRKSPSSSLKGMRLTSKSTSAQPLTSNLNVGGKTTTRRWKVVRRMVIFNFALMGLFLAAAYFLHPKCCEYSNTFCFSLVPHLTHESLPPI